MDRDPQHWLFRLTPGEWLAAAIGELQRADLALRGKQRRAGVAGARRAAGMAWNAVLAAAPTDLERFGRSYMDHLRALCTAVDQPAALREAARRLVDAPLEATLVQIGPGDAALARDAELIVDHARDLIGAAPVAS